MANRGMFEKGLELEILSVDDANNRITYRLGREKRYNWSDPEEKVRAGIILDLIFNYQYSPQRIDTEVPIPSRMSTTWADIVVFRDDRRKDPYITVETASPDISENARMQKIEQLFGYANALASEFAVYEDTIAPRKFWRVQGYGGLERQDNAVADIPHNYGDIPKYIHYRSGENDLVEIDAARLAQIFSLCHRELWSGGKSDPSESFDEFSKLMFAKLYDERYTRNGEPYRFQWGVNETDIMVAQRIVDLYKRASEEVPGIFSAEVHSEPNKIATVVRLLQKISLSRTDSDAKGRAFEQFLGDVFRGRLGQYFTRREIVDCLVDMVEPNYDDFLIDPACGSGGFLVYAMNRVFESIESDYAGDESTIFQLKNSFAQNHIYGIEINERIARVAMMDMVINEDGHTNIENSTAFDDNFTHNRIKDGAYSLVLANPPFGDNVRQGDHDKLGHAMLEDYTLARNRSSAKSEVLFIERCARFLGPRGRLGIVLPDGIFSNPSDLHVRDYILENFQIIAIITLPTFAFRKAGSGMKTSLLIARKWTDNEDTSIDYTIFMALAEHIGYDATARPDTNDLPDIVEHFRNGTGSSDDQIVRIRRKDATRRLDPFYYYLGPIIDNELESISYPAHPLHSVIRGDIQSGKSPSGGAKYSVGSVPILLVGNITAQGTILLDELFHVDEEFFDQNKGRAGVESMDILIAKDGATTGKVGLVPQDFIFDKCLINEHIFKLSVGPTLPCDSEPDPDELDELREINTYYVFFFLKSQLGQRQIAREISGGAQGGITKAFMQRVLIPVPPVSERARFVQRARSEYDRYMTLAAHAQEQYDLFQGSLSLTGSDNKNPSP